MHMLCSTLKVAAGRCHGKDGERAVTVPVTPSAALTSCKTAKRKGCVHQPAVSFTPGPACAPSYSGKGVRTLHRHQCSGVAQKNTILFFLKIV